MRKYLFKVFDKSDDLVIQLIVSDTDIWSVLDNLQKYGTVKCTLLDEESN